MTVTQNPGAENAQSSEDGAVFDLNLPDKDIIQLLKKPIRESRAFWDDAKGHNLTEVRKQNRSYWKGDHYEDIDLYDYQTPYVDNRVFTSIETITAIVNSRTPQPQVFPAQNTLTSIKLARDLEKAAFAWAEEHNLKQKFRTATRHVQLDRLGLIKLRFDPFHGRLGDIVPEVCDVSKIIVDKDARLGENPKFIAQEMDDTIEDMLMKYPDAKEKIFKFAGIDRGVKSQLAKKLEYLEVWFTYVEDGEPFEGVAWLLGEDTVLGKMRTPIWIDEEDGVDAQGNKVAKNFLDMPLKPFIPINYLNLGDHWIDDTTAMEQAAPMQIILNKRGRQLTENADQANGGLIFNTNMIKKKEFASLIGAPDERIGVAGDVRSAVTRIAPPFLPDYVIQDKFDARAEIDNIFGTHAPSRGEKGGQKTLGQDVLQTQQDYTRQDELVRCIEQAADLTFKLFMQMAKVFYDEDHMFRVNGDAGQFDFVVMNSDYIEDGLDIRIQHGTTLPLNREQIRSDSVNLAQSGLIDPLTLYENLGFPNAQKMVERLVKWMTDPMSFVQDMKTEEINDQAFVDIQIMRRGVKPDLRSEISVEYLRYLNKYMMSGEFREQEQEIQDLIKQFTQDSLDIAKEQMKLMQSQAPTPEEMEANNQKAVQDAAMQKQMGGDPNAQAAGGAGLAGASKLTQPLANVDPFASLSGLTAGQPPDGSDRPPELAQTPLT